MSVVYHIFFCLPLVVDVACYFVKLCAAHGVGRVVLNSAESRIINTGAFES